MHHLSILNECLGWAGEQSFWLLFLVDKPQELVVIYLNMTSSQILFHPAFSHIFTYLYLTQYI